VAVQIPIPRKESDGKPISELSNTESPISNTMPYPTINKNIANPTKTARNPLMSSVRECIGNAVKETKCVT
jgi:hypothetical protein